MIEFPCAKINLGLNIVSKRPDGYHNLQTVFFPIPLYDALEIKQMAPEFPSERDCDIKITGNNIDCNEDDNLVIRAYNILAKDFEMPRIHAHLFKNIPSEAGLGGGSSDAAFMIRLLDKRFRLNIGNAEMENYAMKLGADCPFFITAEPSYAEGIGEKLSPVNIYANNLKGYTLAVIKPNNISISTKLAFSKISPKVPEMRCCDIVRQDISCWKDLLHNDFEDSVFPAYPELMELKNKLYAKGALYAQMSGSGSSIYAIYENPQHKESFEKEFTNCKVFILTL